MASDIALLRCGYRVNYTPRTLNASVEAHSGQRSVDRLGVPFSSLGARVKGSLRVSGLTASYSFPGAFEGSLLEARASRPDAFPRLRAVQRG